MFILKAIKSHLKGLYMINRILHSWSLHMKFMKLIEGFFINFIWNIHSWKILYFQTFFLDHGNPEECENLHWTRWPVLRWYTRYCTRHLKREVAECEDRKKCFNKGIKHGFPSINVCQVPREMLKTAAEGFQHFPRDLANVNALENNVCSLLLHKIQPQC